METKFDQILDIIDHNNDFIITGHQSPDGDCLGSQIALKQFLHIRGTEATILNPDPPDPVFQFLPHFEWFETQIPEDEFDVGIVTDSGDINRTGHLKPILQSLDQLINIDHHHQNGNLGDVNLVDPNVSSVGEIIYKLYRYDDQAISPSVAEALYVSLLTDTGSFRHSNTTPDSHRIAAELIEIGDLEPHKLYNTLYERESMASTRLLGYILTDLQTDGGVVWGTVSSSLFDQTETSEDDLNDVISYIRRIEDCRVALLFRERDGNEVKINFRAKGDIQLLDVVEKLGGGGHQQAAGATVRGQLENVADRVVSDVKEYISVGT